MISSVGASVSLICLVEPLPRLEKLVWTKGNRKIIPNSEYTIVGGVSTTNQQQSIETNDENSILSKSNNLKNNIKVKFEHVSVLNGGGEGKLDQDFEDDAYASQQVRSGNHDERDDRGGGQGGEQIEGVTSTDGGKSVSVLKSVLTIKNVRKQDFGIYRCKASNAYGSRRVVIVLREKSLLGETSIFI